MCCEYCCLDTRGNAAHHEEFHVRSGIAVFDTNDDGNDKESGTYGVQETGYQDDSDVNDGIESSYEESMVYPSSNSSSNLNSNSSSSSSSSNESNLSSAMSSAGSSESSQVSWRPGLVTVIEQ